MFIILLFICIFGPFFSVMLFHLKNNCFLIKSFKAGTISIPGCHTSFKRLVNNLSSAVYFYDNWSNINGIATFYPKLLTCYAFHFFEPFICLTIIILEMTL